MKRRTPPDPAYPTRLTTILAIFVAGALAACTSPSSSPPTAPHDPTIRVIARFAPAVLDPLDPAFLARLADRARVSRIDPIREMSGTAYVLQVTCVDPQSPRAGADACPAAVARLRRSDVVLGIEVDQREKPQ